MHCPTWVTGMYHDEGRRLKLPRRCESFLGVFQLRRQHFANMTQTALLMWLRHAGACVKLGLVTLHSVPFRVVTVTAPQSLGTILTRPTRRSAGAAATVPALARQSAACEADARASSAA